jgi:hypothetical protein
MVQIAKDEVTAMDTRTERTLRQVAVGLGTFASIYAFLRLMGVSSLDALSWFGLLVLGFLVVCMIAIPILLVIDPLCLRKGEGKDADVDHEGIPDGRNEEIIPENMPEEQTVGSMLKHRFLLILLFSALLIIALTIMTVV